MVRHQPSRTWRLSRGNHRPRPLDAWTPTEHRELHAILTRALGTRGRTVLDVLASLVHARPVLFDGEIVEMGALRDAGIEAIEVVREPPRAGPDDARIAIAAALHSLLAMLRRHAPDVDEWFASGAWREDVEMLEATLERPLPDQLRAWLILHDGAHQSIGRWKLAKAASIESTWAMLRRIHAPHPEHDRLTTPHAGVRARWWSPSWIPFASDGSGDHLCIDLDPAPGGVVGQVIELVHDHGDRPRISGSLASWFEAQSGALEQGGLIVVEDEDGRFDGVLDRNTISGGLGGLRIRSESP